MDTISKTLVGLVGTAALYFAGDAYAQKRDFEKDIKENRAIIGEIISVPKEYSVINKKFHEGFYLSVLSSNKNTDEKRISIEIRKKSSSCPFWGDETLPFMEAFNTMGLKYLGLENEKYIITLFNMPNSDNGEKGSEDYLKQLPKSMTQKDKEDNKLIDELVKEFQKKY